MKASIGNALKIDANGIGKGRFAQGYLMCLAEIFHIYLLL